MIKRTSISVGIPAYNEQENIENLINSILSQKNKYYNLVEIIIESDGSSDNTINIVDKLSKGQKRIKLKRNLYRKGKSTMVNKILKEFNSDLLILLDADVYIRDENFFDDITKEYRLSNASVIGVSTMPLPGKTFFEMSLNYSVKFQDEIRSKWNNGRNYLCFRGSFIAISKEFAKSITLPMSLVNDDAFIYFSALNMQKKTKYIAKKHIWYKSPASLEDHINQSSRFQNSRKELGRKFNNIDIEKEYLFPRKILLFVLLKYFILNPVLFIGYFCIYFYSRIFKTKVGYLWNPPGSTKHEQR